MRLQPFFQRKAIGAITQISAIGVRGFLTGIVLKFAKRLGIERVAITIRGFPKVRVELRPGTSDWDVFCQVFVARQYDIRKFHQVERLEEVHRHTPNQPVIIDCGANIGLSAIFFKLQYPRAKIYAIEPGKASFAVLERNCKQFSDIIPICAAVWDHKTEVGITDPTEDAWLLRVSETDNSSGSSLPVVTISDLMIKEKIEWIFIAKIDIEGGEAELFRSNFEWLQKTMMVCVEPHDWRFPWNAISRNFLTAISAQKFDVLLHGESMFCFAHEIEGVPVGIGSAA